MRKKTSFLSDSEEENEERKRVTMALANTYCDREMKIYNPDVLGDPNILCKRTNKNAPESAQDIEVIPAQYMKPKKQAGSPNKSSFGLSRRRTVKSTVEVQQPEGLEGEDEIMA